MAITVERKCLSRCLNWPMLGLLLGTVLLLALAAFVISLMLICKDPNQVPGFNDEGHFHCKPIANGQGDYTFTRIIKMIVGVVIVVVIFGLVGLVVCFRKSTRDKESMEKEDIETAILRTAVVDALSGVPTSNEQLLQTTEKQNIV